MITKNEIDEVRKKLNNAVLPLTDEEYTDLREKYINLMYKASGCYETAVNKMLDRRNDGQIPSVEEQEDFMKLMWAADSYYAVLIGAKQIDELKKLNDRHGRPIEKI